MELELLTSEEISNMIKLSLESPRKRSHKSLHPAEQKGQRVLVICMQPETYAQPHKHNGLKSNETFIYHKGKIGLIIFTDKGKIEKKIVLDSDSTKIAEIPTGKFHTLVSLDKDSIVYEVSQGPYDPSTYKELAPWAPAEEDSRAEEYLSNLKKEFQ